MRLTPKESTFIMVERKSSLGCKENIGGFPKGEQMFNGAHMTSQRWEKTEDMIVPEKGQDGVLLFVRALLGLPLSLGTCTEKPALPAQSPPGCPCVLRGVCPWRHSLVLE